MITGNELVDQTVEQFSHTGAPLPPTHRRSILYESLGLGSSSRLSEGDVITDVVIEVESPVLQLQRPRGRGKRQSRRHVRDKER